jgi:tRNA (guanine37-N1)-methyltransferase
MRFTAVTLFPELVEAACGFGIMGRARTRGLWALDVVNPRDFAQDAHRTVDDRPYGGGPGMVMMAPPLAAAIAAARERQRRAGCASVRVVHLTPAGAPLTHARVAAMAAEGARGDAGYVLLAGRYEGIDERLVAREVDEEVAIGDFVVSGGELPALMLMDAVVRLLPGATNEAASVEQESFADGLLDTPHYTRPELWQDEAVPEVLRSGNHAAIARWRRMQALGRTRARRPDLFAKVVLSAEDRRLLAEYRQHEAPQATGGAGDGGEARTRGAADDKAGTTSAGPTSLPRTSERKERA